MKQPAVPPQTIANPIQCFSHLHINLVGPLPPSSSGYTHLLTVLDRSTRLAEVLSLRSTSAENCAAALVDGWVVRFGVPQQITSDRGSQFCSSVWDSFTLRLGIKSRLTTPYHPQSNGTLSSSTAALRTPCRHVWLAPTGWTTFIG
jgi:transposase InsO family protein